MQKLPRKLHFWAACFLLISQNAYAETRPVVLELFTSQGCSSCPAAEALLKTLNQPGVLALSLHVKYWDYLGWKDPYATDENSARQRAYGQVLKDELYTPQMVIDGASVTVGSDSDGIHSAMQFAHTSMASIPITLKPNGTNLRITLPTAPTNAGPTIPIVATLWAMQYKKNETTDILAGENKGRRLEGLHNVIKITQLGTWSREAATYELPIKDLGNDGIAILLQGESYGRLVGAATYND